MDAVYNIGGEQVSIREAVRYVNDWCNKNWVIFEPEYTYQVKTAYVCKTNNIGYYFGVVVCMCYYGMRVGVGWWGFILLVTSCTAVTVWML